MFCSLEGENPRVGLDLDSCKSFLFFNLVHRVAVALLCWPFFACFQQQRAMGYCFSLCDNFLCMLGCEYATGFLDFLDSVCARLHPASWSLNLSV